MKRILLILVLTLSNLLLASLQDFETFVASELKDKKPPSASFAILKGDKVRIYPKEDVSIIILSSQTSVDIDEWADKLIDSIFYVNPLLK